MNLSIQANENSNELRISGNGNEAIINNLVNEALKPIIDGTTRRDVDPDKYPEPTDHWGDFIVDWRYITDWKEREAKAAEIIAALGDDVGAAMSDLNAHANYLEALAESIGQLTSTVSDAIRSAEYEAKERQQSEDVKESLASYAAAGVKRNVATHIGATRNRDEESNLAIGDVLRMANPNKSFYSIKTLDTYSDDEQYGRNAVLATSENRRPWLKFVVTGLNANSVECSVHVDLEMLKGLAVPNSEDELKLQYNVGGTILPSQIGTDFDVRCAGAAHHRDVTYFLGVVAREDGAWTTLSNGTAVLNRTVEFKCVDKYQRKSSHYPEGTVYNGTFRNTHGNPFGVLVSATPNEAKEEADRS